MHRRGRRRGQEQRAVGRKAQPLDHVRALAQLQHQRAGFRAGGDAVRDARQPGIGGLHRAAVHAVEVEVAQPVAGRRAGRDPPDLHHHRRGGVAGGAQVDAAIRVHARIAAQAEIASCLPGGDEIGPLVRGVGEVDARPEAAGAAANRHRAIGGDVQPPGRPCARARHGVQLQAAARELRHAGGVAVAAHAQPLHRRVAGRLEGRAPQVAAQQRQVLRLAAEIHDIRIARAVQVAAGSEVAGLQRQGAALQVDGPQRAAVHHRADDVVLLGGGNRVQQHRPPLRGQEAADPFGAEGADRAAAIGGGAAAARDAQPHRQRIGHVQVVVHRAVDALRRLHVVAQVETRVVAIGEVVGEFRHIGVFEMEGGAGAAVVPDPDLAAAGIAAGIGRAVEVESIRRDDGHGEAPVRGGQAQAPGQVHHVARHQPMRRGGGDADRARGIARDGRHVAAVQRHAVDVARQEGPEMHVVHAGDVIGMSQPQPVAVVARDVVDPQPRVVVAEHRELEAQDQQVRQAHIGTVAVRAVADRDRGAGEARHEADAGAHVGRRGEAGAQDRHALQPGIAAQPDGLRRIEQEGVGDAAIVARRALRARGERARKHHVRLDVQPGGGEEVAPGPQQHRAAALACGGIDRRLDRGGIVGRAIALGAIVADMQRPVRLHGAAPLRDRGTPRFRCRALYHRAEIAVGEDGGGGELADLRVGHGRSCAVRGRRRGMGGAGDQSSRRLPLSVRSVPPASASSPGPRLTEKAGESRNSVGSAASSARMR